MKREIKYRAISIEDNKMYYGYPYCDGKYWYINRPFETLIKVIPSTVTQFTGLKDVDDNEIYEDDIIDTGNGTISRVLFKNGGFLAIDNNSIEIDLKYLPIQSKVIGEYF